MPKRRFLATIILATVPLATLDGFAAAAAWRRPGSPRGRAKAGEGFQPVVFLDAQRKPKGHKWLKSTNRSAVRRRGDDFWGKERKNREWTKRHTPVVTI